MASVACPECGRVTTAGRKTCKMCGTSLEGIAPLEPESNWSGVLKVLGIVVVLAVIIWAITPQGSRSGNPPGPSASTQRGVAYSRCKTAVEGELVAPATAEFPAINEVAYEKEGTIHRFTGEVDSENRLGTPIRLAFICNIEENTEGAFRVDDVLVLEP